MEHSDFLCYMYETEKEVVKPTNMQSCKRRNMPDICSCRVRKTYGLKNVSSSQSCVEGSAAATLHDIS